MSTAIIYRAFTVTGRGTGAEIPPVFSFGNWPLLPEYGYIAISHVNPLCHWDDHSMRLVYTYLGYFSLSLWCC